jgi:hypothetical protein
MDDRRSILMLCNDDRRHAGNVRDHIRAIPRLSRHDVRTFNPILARQVDLGLERYDAVTIHYTIVPIIETYLPAWLSDELAGFQGLKVQFIQDEYRWIDAVTAKIRELEIGLLFTCVPETEVPKIYGERTPETRTVTTLAGFTPAELVDRPVPPLRERPLDVGYRGRTVPYWLGRLGQEKLEIGRQFSARAAGLGLRYDIAWGENDRLYGDGWIRFLSSCRATLGTESGATIADYDGSVEQGVKDYLAVHPAASFEEVEQAVLAPYEGNVDIRVISPRQFEAAALRTALVLFPGTYSGALEPGRHYVPLEKDFSNLDEVAERLRDLTFLEELVARTHEEIARDERYSLAAFVREFDDLVSEEAATRVPGQGRPVEPPRRLRRALRTKAEVGAYTTVRTAFALGLVSSRPRLRALARGYLGDRDARGLVPASAVLEDLLRLAVLLDARSFAVEPSFDPAARRLTFASTKNSASGSLPREAIAEALWAGELEIVWSHVAIGTEFVVPPAARRGFRVRVGYHGVDGAHSFRALRRLGPRLPEQVLNALEPLLG